LLGIVGKLRDEKARLERREVPLAQGADQGKGRLSIWESFSVELERVKPGVC
jgi:hypothetical protein